MASYDIFIKNAAILDGTGRKPGFGAIGIRGEKIEYLGPSRDDSAKLVIDADGKWVAPGFIDITNHSDTHLTIFKYPNQESLLMQGITTVIGGNCGSSLAPLASKDAFNAIKKWADPSEFNINWIGVDEYLKNIETFRPAVNYGTLVGFGTLKRGIINNEIRVLSKEERERIKTLLRDSIHQGAYGLSLGLSYGHERISPIDELIDVVSVLRETGGVLKVHLRYEGKDLLASINEVVHIGRETGVSIQISHLKAAGRRGWPLLSKALEFIDGAKASGINIDFDVSPYARTGSQLYLLIPAGARQGGFADLFRRIDNPDDRKGVLDVMKNITIRPEKILVVSAKISAIVGKTLAEIAEASGTSPEEALLDSVRANEGRVTILGRTLSPKNVETAILNKHSIIASDGMGMSQDAIKTGDLTHPRSFGAFPRFWAKFVTDTGRIPPEEAIVKITAAPAAKFNLKGRGSLTKRNYADLVIFDQQLFRDRATYKNPYSYPAGIDWVIVNGKIAVQNGQILGVREGNVMRRS